MTSRDGCRLVARLSSRPNSLFVFAISQAATKEAITTSCFFETSSFYLDISTASKSRVWVRAKPLLLMISPISTHDPSSPRPTHRTRTQLPSYSPRMLAALQQTLSSASLFRTSCKKLQWHSLRFSTVLYEARSYLPLRCMLCRDPLR